MLFFPRLASGPITRYGEMAEALHHRRHTTEGAADGIRRFTAGLLKKLLLAGPAGALFSAAVSAPTPSAAVAWMGLFGLALQIYFDFSGYTDMAIGLGLIFGFRLPENFRYPYIAESITDFWRRWHITLSAFFKDYVYIPLGGNRKGKFRTVCHLFVVWVLTGLWHGASLNFLLWGLYFFLLLTVEKLLLPHLFGRFSRTVTRLFTPAAILFGWLLFAFDGSIPTRSLSALPAFLQALFGQNSLAVGADLYDLLRHLPFFTLALIGATPLPRKIYEACAARCRLLTALLPLAGLLLALAYMAESSFSPFLYFHF
jgi:alginate O-acetyltransferase complex protein AlgI